MIIVAARENLLLLDIEPLMTVCATYQIRTAFSCVSRSSYPTRPAYHPHDTATPSARIMVEFVPSVSH